LYSFDRVGIIICCFTRKILEKYIQYTVKISAASLV